jgi:hypothetical protein
LNNPNAQLPNDFASTVRTIELKFFQSTPDHRQARELFTRFETGHRCNKSLAAGLNDGSPSRCFIGLP